MLKSLLRALGIYRIYERWLLSQVRGGSMPHHIGVILDGNRRWAEECGLPRWGGYEFGKRKVEDLIRWCYGELGIKTLTLYVLSRENLSRSERELDELMKLLRKSLEELLERREIIERVRVKVLGRLELLPEDVRKLVHEVEDRTKRNSDFFLNLAIAYAGRQEIVDGIRRIAEKVRRGEIEPDEIDEETVSESLYTSHLPNPEPDLIIRTSGEERLSGFLLWQSAYSELYFTDIYWPSFRKIDLLRAIRSYQQRDRRFGR